MIINYTKNINIIIFITNFKKKKIKKNLIKKKKKKKELEFKDMLK